MATTDIGAEDRAGAGKSGSKVPLLVGIVLGVLLGGGGFFAAYMGLLPLPNLEAQTSQSDSAEQMPVAAVSFVPLDPMVVSLGTPGSGRHLRFRAEVEVAPGREADVVSIMPRLIDTLNGYLRAVPIEELEAPSALVRLQAQMLRRIQLISAQGAVRDLLIMEFVLD